MLTVKRFSSFAVFLALGNSIPDALRKASYAACLSVQKRGTQTSFPSKDDLPKDFFA